MSAVDLQIVFKFIYIIYSIQIYIVAFKFIYKIIY